MKNLLLTISVTTLLLAGQAAVASQANDKNVIMPAFSDNINAVNKSETITKNVIVPVYVDNINTVDTNASVKKVIYLQNDHGVDDPSYDAKSDVTSLEYESDE